MNCPEQKIVCELVLFCEQKNSAVEVNCYEKEWYFGYIHISYIDWFDE